MTTTVKSPCILVCAIEPQSGHCYGCGRSRAEIGAWMHYSDDERDAIMADLPARVAKLERRPRRVTRRQRMKSAGSSPTRPAKVFLD